MTERKGKKRNTEPAKPSPSRAPTSSEPRSGDNDEAERQLGRLVSRGLPLACLAAAIVVGTMAGMGSALLIVAAGALLGTIALLWASVRTLSGDAPLPLELEALAAHRHGVDALGEEKRRVLRALKDLESEHAIGKIDDGDYRDFVARYREEAKTVMRRMDLRVAPLRDEAERIARDYLTKRGLVGTGDKTDEAETPEQAEPAAVTTAASDRVSCAACDTSNEADATFCKKCGASLTAGKGDENA
jgi:hypothetical protein